MTDPAVRFADVRRFVEQPRLIGTRFLDRYTVATTSGTTGERGNFLFDSRSHAVTSAMMVRCASPSRRHNGIGGGRTIELEKPASHGCSCGKEKATTGHGTPATAAADPLSEDVSTAVPQLKQRLARLEEQRETMTVEAYR